MLNRLKTFVLRTFFTKEIVAIKLCKAKVKTNKRMTCVSATTLSHKDVGVWHQIFVHYESEGCNYGELDVFNYSSKEKEAFLIDRQLLEKMIG